MGISAATPDGRLIQANPAYAKMYGYENPDEMIAGANNIESRYANPKERKEVLRILTEKGVMKPREMEVVRRDGARFFVLVSAWEVSDSGGKLIYYMASQIDITERRLAENEITILAQSLRSVKECVSITDLENNILFVNSSFLNTYGYSEDELAGKHISIVRLPNMSPDLGKEIMPATLRGGWSGELWNKRKDGSEFLVYLSTTIIHDKDGNILGLIGVATDITERVRAEEEIKESKIQLERLNKHLNDVIENERLKISRDIHDELGQLLTVLKIDLHWTKENIGNKPDVRKKLNGMIDIVNKTIKRVQLISADLRPGMLDDLGLIPAIEWYSQQYEERTGLLCHLELHTVPDLDLQINLLLFRILQEGLTNIARHANAKNVEVKLYSLPDKIYLIIKDDGIGVSKKIINSRDSLGLIGMRERLKQFNGTLEIISSQNNGTRLVISVPIIK